VFYASNDGGDKAGIDNFLGLSSLRNGFFGGIFLRKTGLESTRIDFKRSSNIDPESLESGYFKKNSVFSVIVP